LKTKQKSKRIKSKENTLFFKKIEKNSQQKKAQHNWRFTLQQFRKNNKKITSPIHKGVISLPPATSAK